MSQNNSKKSLKVFRSKEIREGPCYFVTSLTNDLKCCRFSQIHLDNLEQRQQLHPCLGHARLPEPRDLRASGRSNL